MYPALTVVGWLMGGSEAAGPRMGSRLSRLAPPAVCWVGSETGVEKALVERAGLPFAAISAAGLRGRGVRAIGRGLVTWARGFWQARQLVAGFRPDVVFVTGGYVCGPVVVAAWLARVPVVIYLPDVEPGLTIRCLARLARQVAVTTAGSMRFFRPGQAVVTGYPVRHGLARGEGAEAGARARRRLGLTAESANGDDLPVVLAFGGSQGAHSINQAICDGGAALLSRAQVVHLTGQRDAQWVAAYRSSLPEGPRALYHVHAYLNEEMVDALLAADVVVARAGASTLGELPAVGVPSVLVPYPYAGAHQWANARFLAEAGAAVIVADDQVPVQLVPTVVGLLGDAERRAAMSRAARGLARPDAAESIARVVRGVGSRE